MLKMRKSKMSSNKTTCNIPSRGIYYLTHDIHLSVSDSFKWFKLTKSKRTRIKIVMIDCFYKKGIMKHTNVDRDWRVI